MPENVLKMGPVHPAPDKSSFEPADFMADFCAKNKMEAVLPSGGREHGLPKAAWLEMLGPDSPESAFQAARAADPTVMLCNNDLGPRRGQPPVVPGLPRTARA